MLRIHLGSVYEELKFEELVVLRILNDIKRLVKSLTFKHFLTSIISKKKYCDAIIRVFTEIQVA